MSKKKTKSEEPTLNDTTSAAEVVREKLTDAMTPGYQAEFDPEEADRAGAFVEEALTEQDAAESDIDLIDAEVPLFIEDGPSLDIPANITTTNARMLFGKQPGESIKDALDRIEREKQPGESIDDTVARIAREKK